MGGLLQLEEAGVEGIAVVKGRLEVVLCVSGGQIQFGGPINRMDFSGPKD